ncbi:hypothetical protein [Myceligenerans pegani]|uniref:Uncharacterized protein n=1 Tax=Myceligenerans pegani TaxID=2776917 RepID=A0ABR9MSQ9_9MICO|nr:hypothetical protein [Myceligenerans sp. TRM 65318]MBE1874394.1 hypothetical protein [Myceligenerans sp. TRM 65318]MBE3016665.1 hypothetical protein [Myceligenerans sp. TRM 65318]
MSDSPSTAPQTGPEPEDRTGADPRAEVHLHDVVDPADVRRAPRYGRFLMVGAVVGIVIGLALGWYAVGTPEAAGMLKPGVYVAVITAFTGTLTTLAAGLLAILADRRSLRRYERARSRR